MGISDFASSISSGIDDLKQAASDAVDTVEQKASDAVDTVEQKAGEVAHDVEDGAKKAAAWAGHQYDAAASALQSKLNPDATPQVEGGEKSAGADRTGSETEKVDLSSQGKIEDFLKNWGQEDNLDDTKTDRVRCQSNTAIAGMLMNGGPQEAAKGFDKAAAEADKRAAAATDPEKKGLADAAGKLREAANAARNNELTPEKLDRASDALFKTFDSKDVDWTKNPPDLKKDAKGNPTGGMSDTQIRDLEGTLGLTSGKEDATKEETQKAWYNPSSWFDGKTGSQEAADRVWDDIDKGTSAHVGVNGDAEALARGCGPHGEALQKDDASGRHFYHDKITNQDEWVEGRANHAVLWGKDNDGNRYIYNPEGNPPLANEKNMGKGAFDKLSSSLMGGYNKDKHGGEVGTDDYRAKVTKYS